MYFLQYTS